MGFSYSPFPTSIQRLIGTVVGAASKLGFHGKAKVTKEGEHYVIALRVRDVETPTPVLEERSDRERKRRARAERR